MKLIKINYKVDTHWSLNSHLWCVSHKFCRHEIGVVCDFCAEIVVFMFEWNWIWLNLIYVFAEKVSQLQINFIKFNNFDEEHHFSLWNTESAGAMRRDTHTHTHHVIVRPTQSLETCEREQIFSRFHGFYFIFVETSYSLSLFRRWSWMMFFFHFYSRILVESKCSRAQ